MAKTSSSPTVPTPPSAPDPGRPRRRGALGAGPGVLDGVDRVVVSPGVRPADPVLRAAEERGRAVILPEVGLGLRACSGPGCGSPPLPARTARPPSSTCCIASKDRRGAARRGRKLLAAPSRLLRGGARPPGRSCWRCPPSNSTTSGRPGFEVAALLNVRPDHLNWHDSFEEYARDKLRVFEGQGPDDLALVTPGIPSDAKPRVASIGGARRGRGRHAVRDGRLFAARLEAGAEGRAAFRRDAQPRERHLRGRRRDGLGAGSGRSGRPCCITGPCRTACRSSRTGRGLLYVDDSKATNPAAVAAALDELRAARRADPRRLQKQTDFAEVIPRPGWVPGGGVPGRGRPAIFALLRGRRLRRT